MNSMLFKAREIHERHYLKGPLPDGPWKGVILHADPQ